MVWPGGRVKFEQYRKLHQYVDGTNGTRIQTLPLEWAFRRDKVREGVAKNYAAGREWT